MDGGFPCWWCGHLALRLALDRGGYRGGARDEGCYCRSSQRTVAAAEPGGSVDQYLRRDSWLLPEGRVRFQDDLCVRGPVEKRGQPRQSSQFFPARLAGPEVQV